MTDISVQKVKISFEFGSEVLRDVSFTVAEGEHIGILGRNGAGKTTLLRIITGELTPDEGSVSIASGKRIGVLSQIPDYPADYTGEDVLMTAQERVRAMGEEMSRMEKEMAEGNTDDALLRRYDSVSHRFLSLGGYELERFRNTVANGLGIPKEQRDNLFSNLSGGEKTRMNLARLILEDTDMLLLDEPTNHLDMPSVEWLEDYISRFAGTVLIISHDRFFLDKTVSRIIEVQSGNAEFYSGNYTFYLEEKQKRYKERLKRYEKEQAKIAQLRQAADDLHLWAFMGNDKLHKRAFSIEKRIEKMNTTDRPETERKLKVKISEYEFKGDDVIVAENLKKSMGDKELFSDVSFLVRHGERIAVVGMNGTGKTTLIRMIMNQLSPDTGLIRIGPAVKAAYLPQVITFDDDNDNVLESVMNTLKCEMQEARDRLASFGFRGEDVFTKVSALSGGERSRLKLCMLMARDINLLILDEPTNHLDTMSREWVEDILADYGGTLIFVSHDRYFIDRFATRVWEIKDGKMRDFAGTFERYRDVLAREQIAQPVQKKDKEEKPKEKKKLHGSPEKFMAKLEREIAALEEKIKENERLAEEFYADYEKLMELETEKNSLTAQLDEKYIQWEELAEMV